MTDRADSTFVLSYGGEIDIRTHDSYHFVPATEEHIANILDKKEATVYDLAKIAFDSIGECFAKERADVGMVIQRLSEMGRRVDVKVFGPDEGCYYIRLPRINHVS